MKVKSYFVFGISVVAGLVAGLSSAFFITTTGSLQADAALIFEHQNIAENFTIAAVPTSDAVQEVQAEDLSAVDDQGETLPQESMASSEDPAPQAAASPQVESVPQEAVAAQNVQPVYYCDISGCTRTDYHEHDDVYHCDISGCTRTDYHEHDDVYHCDISGCPRTDYHEHGVCAIAGCTETGPHHHDGVYCYPHHQNDGHSYHSSGNRSGHHRGHHGGHH
ncbi:MAG: hypothetical protein HFI31_16690 [Lachnospiraceae bacterium]|jgi:hypothetical protein|nr:hypothetical protein [Lachnospiraceae bacterium]